MQTDKVSVKYSNVNKNFELSNTAILRLFQDVAIDHVYNVGEDFINSDLVWFLLSYKVKVLRRPKYFDKISVSTWSSGVKGFLAARSFNIVDDKGETVVTAESNWVRINRRTEKMERVDPETIKLYEEYDSTKLSTVWLTKLVGTDKVDFEKEVTIERNFIDTNEHVNNVAYLDLAYNILPEKVLNNGEPKEFDIAYKKAVKYHDTVLCEYAETEDGYFVTLKSKDKVDTYAIIKFAK